MKVEIRRLTPSDAPDLVSAIAAISAAEADDATVERTAHVAHLTHALGSPHCYVFLALDGESPVGYVSAHRFPRLDHDSDQVYVFDIEVAPHARRRGVGRTLMKALLEACWADGATWAWAGTARENAAAQALFDSVEGERTGETYVEYEFEPRSE